MTNDPPDNPIRKSATTILNAYVLEPTIMVRRRVQATWVAIVTNPEMNAQTIQNLASPAAVVGLASAACRSSELAGVASSPRLDRISVRRSATIETMPIKMLMRAAI